MSDVPRTSPTPSDGAIATAVRVRYEALASGAGSLSCGAALERAEVRPGETVVDLGCGRGRDVLRAAALVGPRGRATGVDASEAMLAAARAAVPPGLENVTFVRSDLAALALDAASADVVVSSCAVNHAPDKAAVFREVHRVLRPGGRFVVSDPVAVRELPAEVRADAAAWAACYGGAVPEADLVGAARAAGLTGLEVLARSEPYERGGVLLRSLTLKGRRP